MRLPPQATSVGRALAALLSAAALLAPAAVAHTHLASTSPADGARTAVAPRAIVLRFTQPIDPATAVLRVVDSNGRLLPTAATTGDGGLVRVALRGALADGEYAVGYRVLATDGHAMNGGLTFSVAARAGGGGAASGGGGAASSGDGAASSGGGAASSGDGAASGGDGAASGGGGAASGGGGAASGGGGAASGGGGAASSGADHARGAGAAGGDSGRAVVAGGRGPAAAALLRDAVPRDAPWTGPALIAARAGQYAGLVLGLGGVTFLLLAWWPALALAAAGGRWPALALAAAGGRWPAPALAGARGRDPGEATWRATLRVAVAIGAVSAAGGLVVHAFDAAGSDPTAARIAGGLHDHAAILWAEAALCWAGAGVLLARETDLGPRTAKRLLAPLAGALLATALSGHGGSDANIPAAAAAIVHGTAATIWLGAIAWLMLAARRGRGRERERASARRAIVPAAAARVSRLALAAALATLASGVVQALVLAGGPLTLASSGYGRLILAKLALFGVLVGLGAIHRRRTLPALRGTARAGSRPLRATLRAELVIAAALLATAGTLTGSAPPQPAPSGAPSALAEGR